MRLRYRLSHFTHGLEVRNQSILKVPARLCLAVTNGHASQDIRRIGGVASPSLLDDYGIPFRDHFSPAFLSITFSVAGASSLPSLPGTVITNASSGCLKCRWLPLDRISTHPCFSSKRITSRTFIGISPMVRHRGGRATAWPPGRAVDSLICHPGDTLLRHGLVGNSSCLVAHRLPIKHRMVYRQGLLGDSEPRRNRIPASVSRTSAQMNFCGPPAVNDALHERPSLRSHTGAY